MFSYWYCQVWPIGAMFSNYFNFVGACYCYINYDAFFLKQIVSVYLSFCFPVRNFQSLQITLKSFSLVSTENENTFSNYNLRLQLQLSQNYQIENNVVSLSDSDIVITTTSRCHDEHEVWTMTAFSLEHVLKQYNRTTTTRTVTSWTYFDMHLLSWFFRSVSEENRSSQNRHWVIITTHKANCKLLIII